MSTRFRDYDPNTPITALYLNQLEDLRIGLPSPSGASLVGFLQTGVGANASTVQEKLRESVSIFDFLTVAEIADVQAGTLTIDVTAKVQEAFTASLEVLVPTGSYLINPVDVGYPATLYGGGVKPRNGSTIRFQKGAKFVAKTNAATSYVIINLRDTVDVTIYDAEVIGDVATHTGGTGEAGMGFYIASAVNTRLFNCKASKCWGDGFYVGRSIGTANVPSVSGLLQNCVADDNRRQGLSIASWDKGMVNGFEGKNTGVTHTTAPSFGIDIEPDDAGNDLIDVVLIGIRTSGNVGGGLQFVPGFMSANTYTRPKYNVNVIGLSSYRDTGPGLRFAYPEITTGTANVANTVYGQITVSDPKVLENVGRAVDFARWVPTAPDVVINDLSVIDCNTAGSVVDTDSQSAIVLSLDIINVAKQTATGRITLTRPSVVETRAVPKMLLAMNCEAGAGQATTNLKIENPTGYGWASTSNSFLRCINANGCSVTFDVPTQHDLASNTVLTNGAFAGYSYAMSVSGVTELPLAATSKGLEYIFENRYGVTLQIRPNALDTILNFGLFTGNDAVLRNSGDFIKLRSIGGTTWEVVQNVGVATPLGFSAPGKVLYAGAAPVANAWNRGDRVVNVSAAVGSPKAWVCTVAGTPGTWVSEGNL